MALDGPILSTKKRGCAILAPRAPEISPEIGTKKPTLFEPDGFQAILAILPRYPFLNGLDRSWVSDGLLQKDLAGHMDMHIRARYCQLQLSAIHP